MATTEFFVDTNRYHEGVGNLIITDASLLVRPRKISGLYPASVSHDTVHAHELLNIAYDAYTWDIISQADPGTTHQLLDRVFYAFVDACCFQQWCDARVNYIVDGKTVDKKEYGFEDGQYTLNFNVYCGIAKDRTEEFVATLTAQQTYRFVVARPDQSKIGYSIRGFEVHEPDQDAYDDYDYPEENEDPLAGDVEPTGGYYTPPVSAFEAQRLEVMRQHGYYTG